MKYRLTNSLKEKLLFIASRFAKETKNSDEWWCKFLNWTKGRKIMDLSEEISKRAGKKIGNNVIKSYNWLKENEFTYE